MFGKILLTGLAAMLVLSGCSALGGANGGGSTADEIANVNVPIAGESLLADDSERPVEIVPEVYEGSVLANVAYGETDGVDANKGDHIVSASGNEFTVALNGSSSCPPAITDVKASGADGEYNIMLYAYPEGTACTEDSQLVVYDTMLLDGFTLEGKKVNVCIEESCKEIK